MPRTTRPSSKDGNQKPGEDLLRANGYSISDVHVVGCRLLKDGSAIGSLDSFVSKYGETILIEWKVGNAKLNPAEQAFFDNWQGAKIVGRTPEQALADCNKIVEATIPF